MKGQEGLLHVQQEEDNRKHGLSTDKVIKDIVKDEPCISLYW